MSRIQQGLQAISREPANAPIVKRFFRFAAAVAIIPIAAYALVLTLAKAAASSGVIAGRGLSSPPILAGVAAVLALNIVTALFALLALKEKANTPPSSLIEEEEDIVSESQLETEDTRPKTE